MSMWDPDQADAWRKADAERAAAEKANPDIAAVRVGNLLLKAERYKQQQPNPSLPALALPHAYLTELGAAYCGDSRQLLAALPDESVSLFITSPPFALQRQKDYGNKDQSEYIDWLIEFARLARQKLRADGSFVLDLGGAYQKGVPARSLYNFRVLIRFCDELGSFLAEDFYWFNPSKLPSPIEWVNKRKLRAKDSVNTVWWFSKTEWPKADVTKVLAEYSERMKKLLRAPRRHDPLSARLAVGYDPRRIPRSPPTMTGKEISSLREALQLSMPDFAKLLGVDQRSVIRWEAGTAEPTSSAREVMIGVRRAFDADGAFVTDEIRDVLEVGGLALLIERLLKVDG